MKLRTKANQQAENKENKDFNIKGIKRDNKRAKISKLKAKFEA